MIAVPPTFPFEHNPVYIRENQTQQAQYNEDLKDARWIKHPADQTTV